MIRKTILIVVLLIALLAVSASANYWEFLGLSDMRVLSIEIDPINPQYICAGSEEIIKGTLLEESLREFSEQCS